MQFSALSIHVGGRGGGCVVISGTQLHPSILYSATPAPLSPALLSFDGKRPPAALVRGYIHLHSCDVHPRSSACFHLNLTPSFSPSAFATTAQFSRPRRPAVPSVPPESVLQLSVAAGVKSEGESNLLRSGCGFQAGGSSGTQPLAAARLCGF